MYVTILKCDMKFIIVFIINYNRIFISGTSERKNIFNLLSYTVFICDDLILKLSNNQL